MRFKRVFPFVLLGVLALAIAVATFLSDSQLVYSSLWFKLLWGILVVFAGLVIWKRRLWCRPVLFAMHVSLIVILVGALLTDLSARRGILHLRQGIPTDRFLCEDGHELSRLPCLVRLDTFRIVYYPGTEAPADYVSVLTMRGRQFTVNMNHIARIDGYRLYQTSYDEDLQGSILTVNYDPWGTPVTYAGYLLFLLSFLASLWKPFFSHRCRLAISLALFLLVPVSVKGVQLPAISREKADSIERLQVMWNNRPCPMGIMARDFLQKVYGRKSYRGLSATQVLVSWTLSPEKWNEVPIIKHKGKGYYRMSDFIDYSGSAPHLCGMGNDPAVDERVALILMLQRGSLIQALPPDVQPLSEGRVTKELLFGRTPWTLVGICLSLLVVILSLLKRKRLGAVFRYVLFAFLMLHFVLLWHLSGHIPLSNTYETLLFIALCLVPFLPLGTAATLAVALLLERNPQITPLVPVLNSPWLSAHVTCVMFSYALLIAAIFRRRLLRLAVSLLAVGIFLGAVWANVSWGAYWSWDPKESWALITLLVYSLPLHSELLPWFRSERNYRLYSLFSFACLLMTYFGVNYFMGGMHSYG